MSRKTDNLLEKERVSQTSKSFINTYFYIIDRFEDYKEEIEKIPDLSSLPRLHDLITKVRAKREENHDKLELLGAAYNQLKDNIKVVRDEQNNTANTATAVADTKVEEKKK